MDPRRSETGLLLLGALLTGGAVGIGARTLGAGATGPAIALGALGAAAFLVGAAAAAASTRRRREPGRRDGAPADTEIGAALERTVAHDLRSPLGAILNFTTVLEQDLRDRLDEDSRATLARIRRAAASALVLLDGLSRLARVGGEPLRLEPVDVEALVRGASAEFSGGGRPLDLSLGPLPAARADARLLRVAFAELLANAVKFSAPREKVRIQVGGRREPDGTLVYWVADDGIGFDMRFAGKLFTAFERLHSRDEFPGAGVGLAIVRRVAERHGGRAWADAEPERGARFHLSVSPRPEARR